MTALEAMGMGPETRGKITLGDGFLKLIAAEASAASPQRTPPGPPRPPVKR